MIHKYIAELLDVLQIEKELYKKARSLGLYIIKSRDDVLVFGYCSVFDIAISVIEVPGRNYYLDTNYLTMDSKQDGPYKYAIIKFIEDTPCSVKDDGTISEDRYYSAKSPSVNGLTCIECKYDLEEIASILEMHKEKIAEDVKYYGYVQSTGTLDNLHDVIEQLHILQDYEKIKGIKFEKILGVYNLPTEEPTIERDAITFDTIRPMFNEVKESDVVCTVRNIIYDCDGEFSFGFIKKNILKEWLSLKGIRDCNDIVNDSTYDKKGY